ncbi:diguanylate cyclase [Xanthomonadaceae bacterium XH05]|nr:diguanylate cyclase [Xanthomonadaceae bacterium XH05]
MLALLLALFPGVAPALDPACHVSEYLVTAWTMEAGLPHNFVHTVAQDSEGYLWIGSWEGAARFNGRDFTAFDDQSVPGIPLVGVRTILRDTDDALLFGTMQHGVVRLADGIWSRLEPTVEMRLRVISLARAHDGSLWIGTDRSALRLWPDGRLESLQDLGLPPGVVFSLLAIGEDGMLIGSERGLFHFRDERLDDWGSEHGLDGTHVRALLRRSDGSLVIGGDNGAFVLEGDARARLLLDEQIESLLEDRNGALWLNLSAGGLVRHHDGNVETMGASDGLHGRGSPALIEDQEGLLWAGTTNGLHRIADAPAFGLDAARGLGDNYARTILRHSDGFMYVGHAQGVDRWRDDTFEPLPLGELDSSVLALAEAGDGGLWLGTYDRGVLHFSTEAGARELRKTGALPSKHIRALQETGDGSLWIGTTSGLARRHPDGRIEPMEDVPGQPGSFVRGLVPARNGGLWIALANGLMRWHPDGRIQRWLSGRDFPGIGSFDVLETGDGNVFIGSDHGLLRLREGRFTPYDRRNGLPNETLFRLLEDHTGALWACSNRGVFRIDPAQLDQIDAGTRTALSIDILNQASGMPSSQCNGGSGPAGDLDARGRLWLPTALGVAVIDPEATAVRNHVQVPVRIESISADARPLSPTRRHVLAPDIRRVVVRYIGLHFRDPPGVRYRYRMVGFDHDWVDAGNDTEAVYTNLPSGTLRFEVQAAMAPVDWEAPHDISVATLELERLPSYWQRPWFLALVSLGLAVAIFALLLWRSASYRRHQAQLTRIIEKRTHELRTKNEALQQAGRERESLLRQLAHQASHDDLTGLSNRRAGEARLAEAIGTAATSGASLCVALLDIDRFKHINDEHGHEAGDTVLRHIGGLLAKADFVAPGDIARYGGEEFLLVLPDLALASATTHLRELAADIARSSALLANGQRISCSVSIGVAQWQPDETPSQIVGQADRRLYLAKEGGRNRVMASD